MLLIATIGFDLSGSLYLAVDTESPWLLQDATFEKMGALMAENGGRLLGMFDELSTFLTKIKLYSSRGLTDSHELAMFLELYNANPWTRTTGKGYYILIANNYNHFLQEQNLVPFLPVNEVNLISTWLRF